MIRLLLIGLLAAALALIALQVWKAAAKANVDWTGIAFIGGFVAMAFYLRHATGLG